MATPAKTDGAADAAASDNSSSTATTSSAPVPSGRSAGATVARERAGQTGRTDLVTDLVKQLGEAESARVAGGDGDAAAVGGEAGTESAVADATTQTGDVAAGAEGSENAASKTDEEDAAAEADLKKVGDAPAQVKAAFTHVRYALRDANRRNKQLETELAAAKAGVTSEGGAAPEVAGRVTQLEAEIKTYQDKISGYEQTIASVKIEATPEFTNKVTAPRAAIADGAAALIESYKLDPSKVAAALRGDAEAFSAVTGDMSELHRLELFDLAKQFRGTVVAERSLRENSSAELERHNTQTRQEREQQETRERAEWDGSTKKVWERMQDEFPALAPIEGDSEWEAELGKIQAFATPDRFSKMTTEEKVEAMYRTAAFPALLADFEAMQVEFAAQEKRLAKFEAAQTGLDSNSGDDVGTTRQQRGDAASGKKPDWAAETARKIGAAVKV